MINNKKILIINGNSIKENNSTSITINSLLDFFEKDNVIELHYFPVNNRNEKSISIKSIKLKAETKIIYNFISKIYKGKLKDNITTKIVNSEVMSKPSFLEKIKRLILAYNDFLKPNMKINSVEIQQVVNFKPEVIYTLGASIFSLDLAEYFSKLLDIPIVLHHMDNWRETTYSRSKLLTLPRKKLIAKLNLVESRMHYGMTISEEMAEVYSQLSNKKYFSLMHTVEQMNIPKKQKYGSNIINLVYAGGLHLERWKTLKEIEKAIVQINAVSSEVILNIYTKESDMKKYGKLFSNGYVKFYDFLPHDEVYKIYEKADILVHVESFDPQLVKFTKYSLSTKIPEYMASGRPILCYAPEEISSSRYIKKTNTGISVSNFKELTVALEQLIYDEPLRNELGENGVKTSSEKHSIDYKNKVMNVVFEI